MSENNENRLYASKRSILSQIKQENDIKNVSSNDYVRLAEEIREFLIDSISVTGGHLGSNLGCVELTMALHLSLNLPEDKIIDAMKVNGRHVSVDAPFIDGEDNSLLDVFPNADAPSADQQLVDESLRDEISRALGSLNERERAIVECFFGIGQPEMTLEEIGDKYGLTRERVRQIKEKAIRRLRHSTKNKMLKSYLGQ